MPADNSGSADAAALRDVILEPDPSGSVFRFFEIVPEAGQPSVEERQREFEERLASASEEERTEARRLRPDTSRHPSMHRTKTVDYIILLKGEVSMLLDEGEVEMKPFDVLIQRGTNHGWVNRGKEIALRGADRRGATARAVDHTSGDDPTVPSRRILKAQIQARSDANWSRDQLRAQLSSEKIKRALTGFQK